MKPMRRVTLEWINEHRTELDKMSKMTEFDIQNMWIQDGENRLSDFGHLQYRWDAPLFQKMIFRYWNAKKSPSRLATQIDSGNRQRMLTYFGIFDLNENDLVEFFAWLKNGLGVYDLYELHGGLPSTDAVKDTVLFKLWNINEIVFFFGINKTLQTILMTRYNKECVDSYNAMIKNDFAVNLARAMDVH